MGLIYTAHRLYQGEDRLDITAQGADPLGSLFAPSWALREAALEWRLERGDTSAGWAVFVARYANEIERTRAERAEAWQALLDRASLTLVCFCTHAERCHRTVLAQALTSGGGLYLGERTTPYGRASSPELLPEAKPALGVVGGRAGLALAEQGAEQGADETADELGEGEGEGGEARFEKAMAWCTEQRVVVHYESEPSRELSLSLLGLRVSTRVKGNTASDWQQAFVDAAAELRGRLLAERSGTRLKVGAGDSPTSYRLVMPRAKTGE